MKIQVTLYDRERRMQLTRHVISVDKDAWEAMSFPEQGDFCKKAVEKTLHYHWRELEKNEA